MASTLADEAAGAGQRGDVHPDAAAVVDDVEREADAVRGRHGRDAGAARELRDDLARAQLLVALVDPKPGERAARIRRDDARRAVDAAADARDGAREDGRERAGVPERDAAGVPDGNGRRMLAGRERDLDDVDRGRETRPRP